MNSVRDGLSTYSYDATSQLTGADHIGQTDETFAYDANGNRTGSSVTIGTHNHILSDGTSTYTYDLEGNQTSKTNIITGTKTEYTWNHANQLTAVTYKTSTNVVTKSVLYQYDALGRRIGKSVDDTGDGTMDRRESFVYDGAGLMADAAGSIHIAGPNGALNQAGWTDQLLFVFNDSDADGSSLSQLASRNLYGPAVDQIFATGSYKRWQELQKVAWQELQKVAGATKGGRNRKREHLLKRMTSKATTQAKLTSPPESKSNTPGITPTS